MKTATKIALLFFAGLIGASSSWASTVLLRCQASVPGPGATCVTQHLAQVEHSDLDGTTSVTVQAYAVSVNQVCNFEGCSDPGDCPQDIVINDGFSVQSKNADFIGPKASVVRQSDLGYAVAVPTDHYMMAYTQDDCQVSPGTTPSP